MTVWQPLLNHKLGVGHMYSSLAPPDGGLFNYSPINAILGRLRPASAAEIIAAQQEQRRISHIFYCVAGEDIVRGDRITGNGVTVDVMAIREPSRADEHYEIDCLEIQAEVAGAGR